MAPRPNWKGYLKLSLSGEADQLEPHFVGYPGEFDVNGLALGFGRCEPNGLFPFAIPNRHLCTDLFQTSCAFFQEAAILWF
jgi:hypothetical protein